MIVSPVINDVSLPKCLVCKKIWASIHYWAQDSSLLVPDYLKYTYKLVEQMWHDNVFINKTYYTKAVTICKKLLTINCGSHSVTWFIVIASLMISIISPGTMPLEWVCRCTCISVIKSSEFFESSTQCTRADDSITIYLINQWDTCLYHSNKIAFLNALQAMR